MSEKLSKAQKDGNPVNPAFTFYRENKTTQEVKYFVSDLRNMFQKWLRTKEREWLEYYDTYMVVSTFLTAKDGVNSTYNNSEIDEIVRLLKPDYLNALKS